MGPEQKTCQNCKSEFTIEPEDFEFYEKMKVPAPAWCPECRLIRRMARINQWSLYPRACDKCGKSMISVFAPDSGMTVYCSPCWWLDTWDGLDYGVDFDPQTPFFLQLNNLLRRVPVMNLFGLYATLENSDYTNGVSYLKNCYMVTATDVGENLLYGSEMHRSKDQVDNLMVTDSELCYESVNCNRCHKVVFSVDCNNCNNVHFSRNCVNCNDCFGCVNLRSKQYHIYNVAHSKEEYEKKLGDLYPDAREKIQAEMKRSAELWNRYPQKYIHGFKNEDVTGDYISNSKNTKQSFLSKSLEGCRFCSLVPENLTDAYDFDWFGLNSSLLYESIQAGDQSSRVLGGWCVWSSCLNVEYSMMQIGCRNVFGSVGLKKQEFCILNKQYREADFKALREKIITQMNEQPFKDKRGLEYRYGEFYPVELSPFGYNETNAQEVAPLTKEEAGERGYTWRDRASRDRKITMHAQDLPAKVEEVDDSIIEEIIGCEHQGSCNEQCTAAYRLARAELAFYKKMKLPLPTLCPNCRHARRMQFRNPMHLWHRECMCDYAIYKNSAKHPHHKTGQCPNKLETSYAPERPEIVYCEQCYQAEVQ